MKTGWVIGIGCGTVTLLALVCGGIFGGLAYLGFGMLKEVNTAGEAFFTQVAAGDLPGAYKSTAASYQQTQTLEQFTANIKRIGLDDYQSHTANGFNMVNNSATLDMIVATKKGASIPIRLDLVQEAKVWKVSGITATAIGAPAPLAQKPMPTEAELKKLATDSMLSFNKSVEKADFTTFYASISELWKSQTTAEALKGSFQEFIDKKLAFQEFATTAPVFETKPAIDAAGILQLDGYFPFKNLKVKFKLKYTYEHPSWKLIGLNVASELNLPGKPTE